ncbi:hypothetical protein C9417_00255 [Rhizobium sp. SEMIA 4088]|nr:hypothetical protein C9417_00255 [Rhizobium sp. SEMIA 4088]
MKLRQFWSIFIDVTQLSVPESGCNGRRYVGRAAAQSIDDNSRIASALSATRSDCVRGRDLCGTR